MISKPRTVSALEQMARPQALLDRLGVPTPILAPLGGVIVMASQIEYRIEGLIWQLEGHFPEGKRHWTDGKPISARITGLEKLGQAQTPELREMIDAWCRAAALAFSCRNSLVHGVSVSLGDDLVPFMKTPRWRGEVRKQDYAEFHASEHTLKLLQQIFAVLLRSLEFMKQPDLPAERRELMMRALKDARITASELNNLAAAMNHEKY